MWTHKWSYIDKDWMCIHMHITAARGTLWFALCYLSGAHSPSRSIPPDLTQQELCSMMTSPGWASTRSWDFQRCKQDRQMIALRYCLSSFSEFGAVCFINKQHVFTIASPAEPLKLQTSKLCLLLFHLSSTQWPAKFSFQHFTCW